MSHIHIPDGVLPAWIILLGWVLTALLLAIAVSRLRGREQRRLPLLGVMAALMLVGMTLELIPIGYHINLTVISGIVLGPALGFVAAFVVDLILGLLGHGGITVVGLNTLLIGAELALGYYLFRGIWAITRARFGAGLSAASATIGSLLVSTLLMIGIVGVANIDPAAQAPESRNLSFGQGIVAWEIFAAPAHEGAGEAHEAMDLGAFAALVLGLGFIGWLIEAVVTGLIARYLTKVRPDLLPQEPAK